MSCNLIKVFNGEKIARAITNVEEYIALRNSPGNLARLEKARKGDKNSKRFLVQFNYSGYYPDGKVKGNQLPSRAFMFDIDDKAEFERITPILLADPVRWELLMLERSVNGGGHAIFYRTPGRTILECQVEKSIELQCEMDNNAHDINRVCFATSSQPEDLLYLNDALFKDVFESAKAKAEAKLLKERESNGEEQLPPSAHKANKHYRPWEDKGRAPVVVKRPAECKVEQGEKAEEQKSTEFATDYNGIPFQEIIDTYWELYSDNQQAPTQGNRNTSYYELAYNLRHLCGFNAEWLNAVIPDYAFDDTFGAEEKKQCIVNGVNAKQTAMTHKIKDVLKLIRERHQFDPNYIAAVDEAAELDITFYAKQLPALPQGLADAVSSVGDQLAMPVLFASFPAIGALATNVRIAVHGVYNTLNLMSYIAGDFASGKGSIDPVISQWMESIKDEDKFYLEEERAWREQARKNKNKKEQKEEPNNPVRFLTLNNTVANLADRLSKCRGLHAFSFTPEADTLAAKWKSGITDFSVMLRQAYDGSPYEREAKSVDAVNVHIDRLLWNVVMCGTPDALFRVVKNYTDGFLSRIAIARTPDNTFAPLPEHPQLLSEEGKNNIRVIADIIRLFQGDLELAALEEEGKRWLDVVRIETMKDNDAVTARARIRTCITAQRMVACVILCATAEEMVKKHGLVEVEELLKRSPEAWRPIAEKIGKKKEILDTFGIFADYMIENSMAFFHDLIEEAMTSKEYLGTKHSGPHRKTKTIFSELPKVFTFGQAFATFRKKKPASTEMSVKKAIYRWEQQGLVEKTGNASYQKLEDKI